MIKVLIVDDEPKIREGMRTFIPWEETGYQVVDTASNGFEALDKYHSLKPDLMIIDIRMPGMDGLELIAELRTQGSSSHILILSGYADFEYAKRAMAHQVDGYLLKPVDDDELITYLDNLRNTLKLENQFRQWSKAEPDRNKETLFHALLEPQAEEASIMLRIKHAQDLGLGQEPCEVVLFKFSDITEASPEALDLLRAKLSKQVQLTGVGVFFNIPPYVGILLYKPLQDMESYEMWFRPLVEIFRNVGLDFSAVAGGGVEGPEVATISFNAARELLELSFFSPKNRLMSTSSALPNMELKAFKELSVPGEVQTRLQLAVETGNSMMIEPLVLQISDELDISQMDETGIKESFVLLLSGILARLESVYPSIRLFAAEHSVPVGEIYHSHYLSDLLEHAVSYLQGMASQISSEGRGNEIKQITELIHVRYNENLKLETLSELFNYNTAYLGKMFKNTTGEYFNTYLDKVRIENAKRFLEKGMKVYEVAEKVGYMNADYFNAKFRKYEGVSPSSYRKGV
ncbi:response regulator transcription factor [Paenibacillus antarcticus]|uniref:DNA-binding response regulator n=1 Tax=Paenibacillus antarcticus TaxID=253703 RepID=A0A162MAF8_9BACL|nr:response regulator transcription factor [Paenibacillus antarcticus]OAB41073.1 hypothetical protein PBAT_21135 [Paenibacillus antarcticus]